jgi:hypothetical protein
MLLEHECGGAPLMRGVGVAVQEADRDRVDALGLELARGRAHRRLVERLDFAAVRRQPPGDLEDALGRHRALGLLPPEHVGAARDVLPADLEHVAEAHRGDESGRGALALEDHVGRDRRAVQHARDRLRVSARLRHRIRDAVDEAERRVLRRRRRLRRDHPAGRRIEQRHVRERAAGIDADEQRVASVVSGMCEAPEKHHPRSRCARARGGADDGGHQTSASA